MEFACLNGAILPLEEAKVSVSDRGLLLGDGVFETFRLYGGRPFRLGAHVDRLRASAAFLRIPYEPSESEIRAVVETLSERNACRDACVRWTVTRGDGGPSLRMDPRAKPTVLVQVRPLQVPASDLYRRGARLIVSTVRQNSASPLARHKTLNYLPYVLARQEATDAGADGALLLNEFGQVTEEAVSNLFLAQDGALLTPSLHCGLLPGIARRTVMELASREGLRVEERPIPAGEIFDCDEAFVTNSIVEVLPVRTVDRRALGAATPGPVTQRMMNLYAERVREEMA